MSLPFARGSHRLVYRQNPIPLSAAGLAVCSERQRVLLADWCTPGELQGWSRRTRRLRDAYGENQSSRRLQQVCDCGRWRRSALWRSHISLSEWRKLRGDHLDQSRSCVRTGVAFNRFSATLLSSLPSGHVGSESLQTLMGAERGIRSRAVSFAWVMRIFPADSRGTCIRGSCSSLTSCAFSRGASANECSSRARTCNAPPRCSSCF